MKVLHNQDVVRLEGELVAQIWRRPKDDELIRFKDKQLIAVPQGTVSVGMIYRDGRFIRPPAPVSPVVVIQEAPPVMEQLSQSHSPPHANSINVTVNGGEVKDGREIEAHHSSSAPLSGPALQVRPRAEHRNDEPAASAAHYGLHGNVSSSGNPDEYQPSFNGFDEGQQSTNLSGPTIQVNASVDQARFAAANYIKQQANDLLKQIPKNREVVREAVVQTVVQAQAKLAECSTEQEMSLVMEAAAVAIGDYINRSNSGEFGEDG